MEPTLSREQRSCHEKANTRAAPKRTEKDEIEKSLSPIISGTSFIMAMIVPNIAK